MMHAPPLVRQHAPESAKDPGRAPARSARAGSPGGSSAALPRRPRPSQIPLIQRKVVVGSVDDPLEAAADRAAERVLRMPATGAVADGGATAGPVLQMASCADCAPEDRLQRAAVPMSPVTQREDEKIEERLLRGFLHGEPAIQREATKEEEDERGVVQMKRAGSSPPLLDGMLQSRVSALEGTGRELPPSVRGSMESRFGHDFGDVRVHTDADAAETARLVNARAFTHGRNIVFGASQFSPEGSTEGRRLLAHELAHVVQQRRAPRRIQRRIVVAGKPYTPSAQYYAYLEKNFGPAMKEFVEHMHNAGNPPDYAFKSYEQMGTEVRVRADAIKGIEDVHKGCCDYYSNAEPPHLDPAYWDQIGSAAHFKPKSPLPSGKHASDAIKAIFAPGAHTRLECFSMTVAIEYRAMLTGVGEARFNAMFPGGAGIEISAFSSKPAQQPFVGAVGAGRPYKVISVTGTSELLPGDWVYFKNFHDYQSRVPGGFWQGENAIYLGGGKYRGFGVVPQTEHDLNQELVNRYNNDALPHTAKTVADLIADGGGLLKWPVIRPDAPTIAP